MQRQGIEGGPGFAKPTGAPHPDLQSLQSSWKAIAVINKPSPYPMERYTSRPISPHFSQSTPVRDALSSYRQMQSLNAATTELDRILNASAFTSNDGNRARSPSLSPSTPRSRDVQNSGSPIRTPEQLDVATPVSPLSFTSNFRDSIIPVSYIREGSAEAESGTLDGRGINAARRSSTTVIISRQRVMDWAGQDGGGNPNL